MQVNDFSIYFFNIGDSGICKIHIYVLQNLRIPVNNFNSKKIGGLRNLPI